MTGPGLPYHVENSLRTQPDAEKPWIVQKFGGTSVGKFAAKIAEDVVPYVPPIVASRLGS